MASRILATSATGTSLITSRSVRGCGSLPAHISRDEASTACTAMSMGYTFSLPELLAADAGLPADSPLFVTWSFAVLNTRMLSVCLTIAMTLINWTMLDYFIAIFMTWMLTAESPLFWLKQGFIPSIPALITLILLSAEVTARTHKILGAKAVIENGVAWSTGGFYVLTWLATGVWCVMVTLSVVLFSKLRPPPKFLRGELNRKGSGLSFRYAGRFEIISGYSNRRA